MNEKDPVLAQKTAEIEALLNAYSTSHNPPPPPPPEPESDPEEAAPEENLPEERVPVQEPAEEAEPSPEAEVPLEAEEIADIISETVQEEKDAELAEILAGTDEAEDACDPVAPEDEDGGYDDDDDTEDDEYDDEYDDDDDGDDDDDDTEDDEYDDDDDGDDDDDESEEERKLSRFTRGCLEVAIFFAALAVLLLLLEQIGICIGYELPQLFLPLTMAAGSILAMTVCLYSSLRKTLASFVLIASIWFLIMLYAITNFQFPEVIPTELPETGKKIVLTQITTPINANLCVDEILIPGVVSRRFKLPVHPKYVPLRYQVKLLYNEESKCNELYYNELLWAVYDPAKNRWKNATSIGSMMTEATTEPPPETVPLKRKPRHTGRSSTDTTRTMTTTTTTTAKKRQ